MTSKFEQSYYKNFRLELHYDQDLGSSPREWDNVGEIVCVQLRNYSIGDRIFRTADEALQHIVDTVYPSLSEENSENLSSSEKEALVREKAFLLPVYKYEHSDIALSTYPFSCPWDSGQIGLVFVTHEKAREEFGDLSLEELEARATKCIQGELEIYTDYINGNVYGYMLYACPEGLTIGEEAVDGSIITDDDYDHQDSCWGYYGLDDLKKELKSTYGAALVDGLESAC